MWIEELIADPAALEGDLEVAYPLWKRPYRGLPLVFFWRWAFFRKPGRPYAAGRARGLSTSHACKFRSCRTIIVTAVELSPNGRADCIRRQILGDPAQASARSTSRASRDGTTSRYREQRARKTRFSHPMDNGLDFGWDRQIKKVALAGGMPAVLVESLEQCRKPTGRPRHHLGKERRPLCFPRVWDGPQQWFVTREARLRNSRRLTPQPTSPLIGSPTFFPMAAQFCSRCFGTRISRRTGSARRCG